MKWWFEKIFLPEILFLEIMSPEQILSHPLKVLSQKQREDYFDLGGICQGGGTDSKKHFGRTSKDDRQGFGCKQRRNPVRNGI